MIRGSDPALLNVRYIRGDRKRDIKECFEVIYKDGNDVRVSYEEPLADIYIVKPEYRNYDYNKPQEQISRMDKITCKVSEIRKKIAEAIGDSGINFMKQCLRDSNFRALDRLYEWRFVYGADFQPEFYYLRHWSETHNLSEDYLAGTKLTKAYLDIETDIMDYNLDMDDLASTAYCPVNCATLIMDDTNDCYTFILKPIKPSRLSLTEDEYDARYALYEKQLKQYEAVYNNQQAKLDELHTKFDATYGALNYQLRFYEKEIELIADIFRCINTKKPNFCLCWNMRFDIQYLYERIKILGYDPVSIICHKDFKYQTCYFKIDKSTFEIQRQFDYFHCSSYTNYMCQMRNYGLIRKSGHKLPSMRLNYISDTELGDHKVDYPENANIRTFPYEDFSLFITYNIKDVLLQMAIERRTEDVNTIYMRAFSNLTPYSKAFKETHLIRNYREKYFEEFEGKVQGNNLNVIDRGEKDNFFGNDDDDEEEGNGKLSFKGAINANPIWNDAVGVELLGKRSDSIYQNCMDYDMGAFYPSIKIASNMDPETLLFKAAFDNEEFSSGQFMNRSLVTDYEEKDKNGNIRPVDITGEAVNTYVSNNPLTFAYNYLGIHSITDLSKEFESWMKK